MDQLANLQDSDDEMTVTANKNQNSKKEKHFVKEMRDKIENDRKMLDKLKDQEDAF